MDCEVIWFNYVSDDIVDCVDNAIEEYFKTPPIKIIYCHDDYVEVQIREIDPFDEVIRGDIYCGTCSELIGKFDCTANGSNLNVVIIEKG